MKVFTSTEARQQFASVLDAAQKDGAVRITRRDGRMFTILPVKEAPSPLAVKVIPTGIDRSEIVAAVREGRDRG